MKPRTPLEQAERIAWVARFLAKSLSNPDLPAKYRARAERGLVRALKALEPPPWKLSTVQLELVKMLESPSAHLAAGRITEKTAVNRASRAIDAFLSGHPGLISETYRSRRAPRALVVQCLRRWPRGGGGGKGKRGSKYDSVHALFLAIGIESSGPTAIKRLLIRERARKP